MIFDEVRVMFTLTADPENEFYTFGATVNDVEDVVQTIGIIYPETNIAFLYDDVIFPDGQDTATLKEEGIAIIGMNGKTSD